MVEESFTPLRYDIPTGRITAFGVQHLTQVMSRELSILRSGIVTEADRDTNTHSPLNNGIVRINLSGDRRIQRNRTCLCRVLCCEGC